MRVFFLVACAQALTPSSAPAKVALLAPAAQKANSSAPEVAQSNTTAAAPSAAPSSAKSNAPKFRQPLSEVAVTQTAPKPKEVAAETTEPAAANASETPEVA